MTTKLSDLRKINPDIELVSDQGESQVYLSAEVSDLVEALQAEGVGTEVGTEVMTSDGYERRVIPVHWTGPRRFLVAPLGEDA